MTQVTATALTNAALDCDTIAAVATSTEDTVTDRLGGVKRTLSGAINALGYEPPVAYTAALSMTSGAQTVEYSGALYAAKPSEVPFTTSGTFETAKFRLLDAGAAAAAAADAAAALAAATDALAAAVAAQAAAEDALAAAVAAATPDATDAVKGKIQIADSAAVIAAASQVLAMTPGLAHLHPRHIKKVVRLAGRGSDGTCTLSINLGGTARAERKGSGYHRVLWSTTGTADNMASGTYSVLAVAQEGSAPTTVGAFNAAISSTIANIAICSVVAQDATGIVLKCEGSGGGGARDPDYITLIVLGAI